MAVRGRRVRELRRRRGLAQLVRRAEQGGAQQVGLHGGVQALVDGSQRGRRLRQRVCVRPHEAQGLGPLLDALGQFLALCLDGGDARRRLLALGTQRLDACACLGQRALEGQGLLKRAARARRLVAHLLRPLAEIGHGLGRQAGRVDGELVPEGGGQGRDLVSGGLQASRGLGPGRVERRHGQRPAGLARELPVGRDRLGRCGERGERRAHARVLRLRLRQGAALRQGARGHASGCRRGLGEAHCLRVRLVCTLARAARPRSHGAGILRARVQPGLLLGGGSHAVGLIRGCVIAKGRVQRAHPLEGAERSRAPLLDATLRRGGRIGQRLGEVGVDLRVENVAQDLLARIRGGGEELGEFSLRQHDGLEELVLVQAHDRGDLVAHVAWPRRDRLDGAPAVRSVRIFHDPRERRLRVTLRLLTRRRVRGCARHPVDARGDLEHEIHFGGV